VFFGHCPNPKFGGTVMNVVAYRIAAPISAHDCSFSGPAGRVLKRGFTCDGGSFPMYLNAWIGGFAANTIFSKFGQLGTWLCRFSSLFSFAAGCQPSYFGLLTALSKKVRDTSRSSEESFLQLSDLRS
jgi:hypothetical protein